MMEKIMKKMMAAFLLLMVTSVLTAGYLLPAYAREGVAETQINLFLRALRQIDAKEKPSDDAETVFAYDEGDPIYVTGETQNGWYIVYYRGQTGYINKDVTQGAEEVQDGQVILAEELDIEALDDELTAQEMDNKLIAEGVERYLTEARRSKIWGVIIISLVIGIFVVGIISTIRAEKNKKDGNIIGLDKE